MMKLKEKILTASEIKDAFLNAPDIKGFNKILFKMFVDASETITESVEIGDVQFYTIFPKDRYYFDFNMDLNQWMQQDTPQDAHYYGAWVNPTIRAQISYVEGDIYVNVFKDDESFMKGVISTWQWNIDNGYWMRLDPGLNPCQKNNEFMKEYSKRTA